MRPASYLHSNSECLYRKFSHWRYGQGCRHRYRRPPSELCFLAGRVSGPSHFNSVVREIRFRTYVTSTKQSIQCQ
jgi:hypothetical protein